MDVFEKIAGLPHNFVQFSPGTKEEEKAFLDIRLNHIGLALWLKNMVGGEPLTEEAFNIFAEVQVLALLWKARRDLIIGLTARHSYIHAVFCGDPVGPWFWWIAFEARLKVENVLSGETTLSKIQFLNATQRHQAIISDPRVSDRVNKMTVSKFLNGEMFLAEKWGDWLMIQASFMAEQDDFFCENYFEPWQKAETRLARKIYRECKTMTWKNGRWMVSSRGKRES